MEDSSYVRLEWDLELAERALGSGLASLAEAQYRRVLVAGGDLPEASLQNATFGLVASLVAQGDYAEALDALESAGVGDGPRATLSRIIALYGLEMSRGRPLSVDRRAAFFQQLLTIEASQLKEEDLPWYYLMDGLLSAGSDEADRARQSLERARGLGGSPEQMAFFEALVLRDKLLAADSGDEALLADIRKRVSELRGQAAAYPFIVEAAILLSGMDRRDEALALLDQEIVGRASVYSEEERGQLLLLKAMLLDAGTDAGRAALMEIVRTGRGKVATGIALQLLVRAMGEPSSLLGFLSQVIAQSPSHPLIAQLYFLRGQLALASPETASIAEADARFLLEQYPGAREVEDVYRLLAYAAIQRQPPQFRVAAEYLSQLRETATSAEASFMINRQIGDCYFLNRDFANAVDFYRAAERVRPSGEGAALIFFRLVTAEIRAGQLDRAINFVDSTRISASVPPKERWMSEWNIARALMAAGRLDEARARVTSLLADSDDRTLPMALDLRLRWLALYLQLKAGALEGLEEAVASLISRVEAIPAEGGSLADGELSRLKGEFLLLLAEAMFAGQKTEAGLEVLKRLRDAFPGTSAAERTFLLEASHQAAGGNYRAAQSALVELADTYPQGSLAAQALFEAALYCERRGPAHFGEATVILSRLVERYPESPIVFEAGLKQGDLLRLLNDFSSAQLLFENLINAYPGHPLRYRAELAYADCVVALARESAADLSEAAVLLERLLDLPSLPEALRVEVGYKLGLVFQRGGATEEALAVLTRLTSEFLLDPQELKEIGPLGRYWLSRSTIELGSILESRGRPLEARRLYRKMIAFNLPGRSIVTARLGEEAAVSEN